MPSRIFNRDMEAYLDRRRSGICRIEHNGLFGALRCRLQELRDTLTYAIAQFKQFFTPSAHDVDKYKADAVTIVEIGLTPAQRFWDEIKAKWRTMRLDKVQRKRTQRDEAGDVDPQTVQQVIQQGKKRK